jgi:hypothetical protein
VEPLVASRLKLLPRSRPTNLSAERIKGSSPAHAAPCIQCSLDEVGDRLDELGTPDVGQADVSAAHPARAARNGGGDDGVHSIRAIFRSKPPLTIATATTSVPVSQSDSGTGTRVPMRQILRARAATGVGS